MDPYATLGISRNATEDELKRAFRKEAMKWHPDRAGNSPEANNRFHEVSLAYQTISSNINNKPQAESYRSNAEWAQDKGPDINGDDVLWEIMLEYAIGLVRSEYTRKEVIKKLSQNGCDASMVDSIADKAFRFQQEFKHNANHNKHRDNNESVLTGRKFDYMSIQALLGKRNPNNKGRKTISDYHEIFNALHEKEKAGSVFPVSKNRYLGKLFNRSVLLFLVVAAMLYYFPNLSARTPLGMIDFFQLPNVILSLMLVWTVYRKLWLLSLIGVAIFAVTQMYYYYSMPLALEQDFTTIFFIALACYLPFIFLTYLSNFFYYRKAKSIIESVNHHYPLLEEKLILIKNNGGVSRLSAALMTVMLALYFLQMIPESGSLEEKSNWLLSINTKTESRDLTQLKARISESRRQFQIAEEQFNRNPPDYEKARMAYIKAANYGSLLSSYKLGYLYLTGDGNIQDDAKALYYFNQAVNSSLASQPHSLSMATNWLSESYNSLGIMYLGGYGTIKDRQKARKMFTQALKYGSSNSKKNLMHAKSHQYRDLRGLVTPPDYKQ